MKELDKEIIKLEIEILERFEKIKDQIYPCLKPVETEITFEVEHEGKPLKIDLCHFPFYMDTSVFFVMDDTEMFQLIQKRMLPPDMELDALIQLAVTNLFRDFKFEFFEADFGGYAIKSHPDHTSSFILIGQLWKEIAQNKLQDDLIISIPARDIILISKASDPSMIESMKETAQKVFDNDFKSLTLKLLHFNKETLQMREFAELK